MTDPFTIGTGIVGVLGVTFQISQLVVELGLSWTDAPKEVQSLRLELQNLQTTLAELQTRLLSNTTFQEAFGDKSSALLSHLKANNSSKDSVKESFDNCQARLVEIVNDLKAKERGSRLGWERLKATLFSKKTETAISQLQRQCQMLDRLISTDIATLAASTRVQVKEARRDHQEWHSAEESQRILRWLSQLDFEEKHRDILSKLHPGTGQWLLDSDEFKAWRNGHLDCPPNLWCPGIPGAGKTVIAANVVHHLQQLFSQKNVAILYLYCDYKDQSNQTDRNLFASLAKQCTLQQASLTSEAKALYTRCGNGQTSPSSGQCLDLLMSSMKSFRRTFIVIDALDEHLDEDSSTHIPLLYELINVQQKEPGHCTMFITSREIPSIQDQLHDRTRLDIRAHKEDIRSFVNSRIHDEREFTFAKKARADPDLAHEIVEKLVEKAQGMFLLPRLHLDRLGSQISVGKLRKALNDLPSRLYDTYQDAMSRIKRQPEDQCHLALQALSWISKARRPLQVEELLHALAVEPGDRDIDDEMLALESLVVSVCAGLVTIDDESREFRLVHFTVEEFLKEKGYEWFPDADNVIAETCFTYLSFDVFTPSIHKDEHELCSELVARIRSYPLLLYAVKYLGRHVDQASLELPKLHSLASRLLGDGFKVAVAMWALEYDYDKRYPPPFFRNQVPGIFLVVKTSCEVLASCWRAWGGDINATTWFGRTPLMKSVLAHDLKMLRVLIDAGADVNARYDCGRTALMDATRKHWLEGVERLLEKGADPNARDNHNRTCLHYIAWTIPDSTTSCNDIIVMLLEAGLDIEALDDKGNTPLLNAASWGNPQVCKILMQHGAAVEVTNKEGRTPLMRGAREFKDPNFLRCLHGSPRNVNAVDNRGGTALMCLLDDTESVQSRLGAVQELLQAGAQVNVQDRYGDTALMIAARWGAYKDHYKVVGLLLQSKADVEAVDCKGRTPLMHASREFESGEIVKLLLQAGADVEAVDNVGKTALMYAFERPDCGEIVKLLLQAGPDIKAVDNMGKTALTYAFERPDCGEIVKLLLQAGADIEAVDTTGKTALMYTSQNSKSGEIVKLLLQLGANIHATDKWGRTALMFASEGTYYDESDIIKLLLQFGADVNAVDYRGETAVVKIVWECVSRFDHEYAWTRHDSHYEEEDEEDEEQQQDEEGEEVSKEDELETSKEEKLDDKEGQEGKTENDETINNKMGNDKKGKDQIKSESDLLNNDSAREHFKKYKKDIIGILLSAGLSEKNMEDALSLATSGPNRDEEIVQMFSRPGDSLNAQGIRSQPREEGGVAPA